MFNESTLLHNISPEQLREMLEARKKNMLRF
jgi:hypothetical protein